MLKNQYFQKILTREKLLTKRECKLLINAPDRRYLRGMRDYAIILLYLNAGFRKSELLNLDVCDFHDEERDVFFTVMSKGGQELEQPLMSKKTKAAIRKYLDFSGHRKKLEMPLFQSITKKNKPTGLRLHRRSIDHLLQKYEKKCGIKKHVHCHMLRHTFGSQILNVTGNIATTQRALRHKNINSTLIYLHSDKEQVKKALRKFEF